MCVKVNAWLCRRYTHKHCTYSAVQSLHKRGKHRTRLAQELHNIFVCLKRICHLVRTCLTLCCSRICFVPRAHHLPHSLFLLPRHQNTQCIQDNTNLLQEYPVHHQPLQEQPVEKQRYEEPLWRENQQGGGNPRKTFSTGYVHLQPTVILRVL